MKNRKDNQGRRLRTGEIQLPTGKYKYKYVDNNGKERALYSWRLEGSDPQSSRKKCDLSLREKESQIHRDLEDNISVNGGNLTVLQLTEKYINTKVGVKPTTKKNYGTVINLLKSNLFGKKN